MPENIAEKPIPSSTPAPVPVVGINHIALEVGDLDEALEFYGRLFKFEQRGRSESQAEIDLGDQFTKADHILRGMGLGHLRKTDAAMEELIEKGMRSD